jgi:hypothetical protein
VKNATLDPLVGIEPAIPVQRSELQGDSCQGVSYSKKFRVKSGFPNYLEVAMDLSHYN